MENAVRHIAQKSWGFALRLLFPPRCFACGREGSAFCASCRQKIPLRGGFDREGVFSLWEYGHPHVKNAITSLKYKNKRMLAEDIACSLHDALLEHLAEKSFFHSPFSRTLASSAYLVIPIPLSKERLKKRGYNQAELLAKAFFQKDRGIFSLEISALCKIKDTEAQVSVKDRKKRLQNMRGAFEVRAPEKVRGKIILLLDDVTTTGATLSEARRILLKAGARLVYGVTIAH